MLCLSVERDFVALKEAPRRCSCAGVEAVDGRNISLDSADARRVVEDSALVRAKRAKRLGLYSIVHDAENQLVNFDDHFTEGAIACAMSHHKALQEVAKHPSADWGLVLEDDISLVVPHVHRELAGILEQLPSEWTAVFLGYHNQYGCPHPRAVNSSATSLDGIVQKDRQLGNHRSELAKIFPK